MPKFKKSVYQFTEVGAIVYDTFPGHYLNLESAIATVNTHARELGIGDINGKKKYRSMTASDASRVLASITASLAPRDAATPIERAIKASEAPEIKKVEPRTSEDWRTAPVKAPTETVVEKLFTAEDKKAAADAFDVIRKKFYTDVNFFIKYAQSIEERSAIWGALSSLYSLGNKPTGGKT